MHWLFPEAFPQTKVMHLSKECKTLWLGSNLFKKMEKHAKVIHFQSKGFLPSKTGNRCNSFPFRRCFLQQCTYSEINPTLLLLLKPRLPCDMKKPYQSFFNPFKLSKAIKIYMPFSHWYCIHPNLRRLQRKKSRKYYNEIRYGIKWYGIKWAFLFLVQKSCQN